jgi:hypothetical protein
MLTFGITTTSQHIKGLTSRAGLLMVSTVIKSKLPHERRLACSASNECTFVRPHLGNTLSFDFLSGMLNRDVRAVTKNKSCPPKTHMGGLK